jgi:hypothetical protein
MHRKMSRVQRFLNQNKELQESSSQDGGIHG